MREVAPAHELVRFGPFDVDLRNRHIRKHGLKIRLQEQPFRILQILLEHPGELVTREELQRQIWPADTFVDFEQGLNNAIKRLREALGDSAETPLYVETIPKHGYRFVAEVRTDGSKETAEIAEIAEGPAAQATLTSTSMGRRIIASLVETISKYRRARQVWMAIAAGLAIGAVALILVELNVLKVPGWHERVFGASNEPAIHSLAVLPLANLSNDPNQEYFSDGMTDALITDLAQIGSLKVISRTSTMQYKQTKKTLPEIARELNVDGIIEGTVQRSGDRVRISAQLIYGPSDKHVWANSYNRELHDVFTLERDVTNDIARQVQSQITNPNQLPNPQARPLNYSAFDAYLKGRYYVTRGEWAFSDEEKKKAAGYFQQAIDVDPTFETAYLGLADAHSNLSQGSSEDTAIIHKVAEKALELDPNSSGGWTIVAGLKWLDFDWRGAEQDFRRAVALNPNNASAHDGFGTLLAAMGRLDEGLQEGELAQELDPTGDHLVAILELRGEHQRAIGLLQRLVESQPENGMNHYNLYRNYAEIGMQREAILELEKAFTLWGLVEDASNLHRAFTTSGYRGAMHCLAEWIERVQAAGKGFYPENLAYAYSVLGDKDRAFYWLNQAYEHRENASHDFGVTILKTDPMLTSLHSDPRFKDLLRRIGLPTSN